MALSTTSYSQTSMFSKYPRQWWFQYIKKIPIFTDMCYAHGGSIVHKCIEEKYNSKDISYIKQLFEQLWTVKYKLNNSIIKDKKDSYWLMIVEGINRNIKLTDIEYKVWWPDVVGYIDGINKEEDIIIDWKTSTRSKENEEDYIQQLKFYSYLYYRKFNKLPKKCEVQYLKYTGTKGLLLYTPDIDDILKIEEWHFDCRKKMEHHIMYNKIPPMCEECNHFCPFKSICFQNDNDIKFKLIIHNNNIIIQGNITNSIEQVFEKRFSYELKDSYFIKQALQDKEDKKAREQNRPPRIVNYDGMVRFYNPRNKSLPLGFYDGVVKILNDYAQATKKNLNLEIEDLRKKLDCNLLMPDSFINGIKLREYQEEAKKLFIRNKIGVLELATGSGKTEIGIECIRELKTKTLFIVDRVELLNQTKKRIENSLGIKVGTIRGKDEDIKDVTVATIQSLNKKKTLLREYLANINFVIFDECHKTAAKTYFDISKYLINTQYRLGLTGTAFRDDKNDMYITASCGYILHRIKAKNLIDDNWLEKPNITFIEKYMTNEEVRALERNASTGLINETENYQKYYKNFILENDIRNNIIKEIVEKRKGKKILILTKLVDHGKYLTKLLGGKHLYGDTNKKEREQIFEDFVSGKNNILISTLSIFAEGIDIPTLEVLINASGNKGEVKTIQLLGRVLRKSNSDKKAEYFDFIDETRFFKLASLSRKNIFRKEGHLVETKKWESFKNEFYN